MRFCLRLLAATFFVCAPPTSTLLAQSSSGTISGRVLDATGHSVPGATVTVSKVDTREVRTFSTSELGEFVFTALQPGPYSLKVEATGFKTLEKTELVLNASERLAA